MTPVAAEPLLGYHPCSTCLLYTSVMEQTGSQKALDKEEQTQIMEKMELPDILKTSLMENNTAETYRYLAVKMCIRDRRK